MTKWIFLGDDSRWQFICWLLGIALKHLPEQGRKTISIKHGANPTRWENEADLITAVTYNIPPEIEILIPTYGDDMQFSLQDFNRCAIFETYPFGRESTEELATLLESGRQMDLMVLFVLMDLPEEAETDPLVDVKSRKLALINKNRDVMTAHGSSDVLEILHWHRPIVSDLRRRIRNELLEILNQANRVSENYNEYIDKWTKTGILNSTVKESIISFSNVKGRPHIWRCYNEAAQRILFPTLQVKSRNIGIYEAAELYKKILYNSTQEGKTLAAFIWNVEADVKQLIEKFKQRYAVSMTSPKKFHNFLTTDEYSSEHIYKALVDKPGGRFYGIKEEFIDRYENFICREVLEIMTGELESHIERLKGMI